MPRITPLRAAAATLVDRGWTHLDVRLALTDPEAVLWTDRGGLVASFGSPAVVHAIEAAPLGPSAALLSELLPALPRHLELRVGPAAAGVLAETHQIEMIGPVRRLVWRGPGVQRPSLLAVPVSLDAVQAIPDRDAPEPVGTEWLGLRRDGELIAAMGIAERSRDVVRLTPPRMSRQARTGPEPGHLAGALARGAATGGRTVFVDIRADRRDRIGLLAEGGFDLAGAWERWRAARR